jgi:hypothetical protein
MHYEKAGFTPTNATWSVSLYQGPNYVPNVLNRYDIAPWMPLKFNPDGSLDIYIQATSPAKDKKPIGCLPLQAVISTSSSATTGPRKRRSTAAIRIRRSREWTEFAVGVEADIISG